MWASPASLCRCRPPWSSSTPRSRTRGAPPSAEVKRYQTELGGGMSPLAVRRLVHRHSRRRRVDRIREGNRPDRGCTVEVVVRPGADRHDGERVHVLTDETDLIPGGSGRAAKIPGHGATPWALTNCASSRYTARAWRRRSIGPGARSAPSSATTSEPFRDTYITALRTLRTARSHPAPGGLERRERSRRSVTGLPKTRRSPRGGRL